MPPRRIVSEGITFHRPPLELQKRTNAAWEAVIGCLTLRVYWIGKFAVVKVFACDCAGEYPIFTSGAFTTIETCIRQVFRLNNFARIASVEYAKIYHFWTGDYVLGRYVESVQYE